MILGYTSQSIKNILASHCDYVCTSKLSKSGSALALTLRESGVGVFIHWATCSSLQKRDPTETEVGKPTGHQTATDPEGLAQVYVRRAPAARDSHHAVGVCRPRGLWLWATHAGTGTRNGASGIRDVQGSKHSVEDLAVGWQKNILLMPWFRLG